MKLRKKFPQYQGIIETITDIFDKYINENKETQNLAIEGRNRNYSDDNEDHDTFLVFRKHENRNIFIIRYNFLEKMHRRYEIYCNFPSTNYDSILLTHDEDDDKFDDYEEILFEKIKKLDEYLKKNMINNFYSSWNL